MKNKINYYLSRLVFIPHVLFWCMYSKTEGVILYMLILYYRKISTISRTRR